MVAAGWQARRTFDGKPHRDDVLQEVEADRFAANFLVPMRDLERLRPLADEGKLSRKAVKSFAAEIGVAPGIVVTRLQLLGWIPPRKFNTLKTLLRRRGPTSTSDLPAVAPPGPTRPGSRRRPASQIGSSGGGRKSLVMRPSTKVRTSATRCVAARRCRRTCSSTMR